MQILDRFVKTIHRKEVSLVKVLWSQQGVEEAIWQCEDEMRQCFPRLFFAKDGDSRYQHTPLCYNFHLILCLKLPNGFNNCVVNFPEISPRPQGMSLLYHPKIWKPLDGQISQQYLPKPLGSSLSYAAPKTSLPMPHLLEFSQATIQFWSEILQTIVQGVGYFFSFAQAHLEYSST